MTHVNAPHARSPPIQRCLRPIVHRAAVPDRSRLVNMLIRRPLSGVKSRLYCGHSLDIGERAFRPQNVKRATSADGRRSRRFPFVSPVEATWQEPSGAIVRESGRATEVNAQGGLLELKTYPPSGSQIELKNLISHESSHARVVGPRRSAEGHLLGIAVELLIPSETFWGSSFQLKKACAELVRLEYDMRTGPIDPRVLQEFRDAVDNVRKTAWAVQEWQERQSKQQDPKTVIPLLTAEGIRRATQLCDAIASASAAHEIGRETVGIREFFQSVERLHQSLAPLFANGKP
jgi:hypothetical protein